MRLSPSDARCQASFSALGEQIGRHIDEEERDLLPRAARTCLNWEVLEAQVLAYKQVSEGRRTRKRPVLL